MQPSLPLPAGVGAHSSPAWVKTCRDLATVHAGPPGGFDLTSFGRIITVGPVGEAGGYTLTDQDITNLTAFLLAPR